MKSLARGLFTEEQISLHPGQAHTGSNPPRVTLPAFASGSLQAWATQTWILIKLNPSAASERFDDGMLGISAYASMCLCVCVCLQLKTMTNVQLRHYLLWPQTYGF